MTNTMRVAAVAAILAMAACGGDSSTDPASSDPSMLVDKQVTVPPNGGYVNVSFTSTAGQKVRITLVGATNSVGGLATTPEPYGSLTNPSGTDAYHPTIATAVDGHNTEDVTLAENGRYTLTIFDGSGAGTSVHVTVQKIT